MLVLALLALALAILTIWSGAVTLAALDLPHSLPRVRVIAYPDLALATWHTGGGDMLSRRFFHFLVR